MESPRTRGFKRGKQLETGPNSEVCLWKIKHWVSSSLASRARQVASASACAKRKEGDLVDAVLLHYLEILTEIALFSVTQKRAIVAHYAFPLPNISTLAILTLQ